MTIAYRENPDITKLTSGIKWLNCDVDGVLTDGGVYLFGKSGEAKRFDIQDGMGITLAREAGLRVGFITGRSSLAVSRRAKELKIDYLSQGEANKAKALDEFIQTTGAALEEIAYIGDDIQDIPILQRVGLPIAVNNARPEVKRICVYVTQATGGHGAVREAVEWLLDARGKSVA